MKIQTNFKTDLDYSNAPYRLMYVRLLESAYGFSLARLDPETTEKRNPHEEALPLASAPPAPQSVGGGQ